MYSTYGIFNQSLKLKHLIILKCQQSTLTTPNLDKFAQFLKDIETKWKRKLEQRFERERFNATKAEEEEGCSSRYILSMFPYPSGRLHLGHVRIYTSADILARQSRLLSKHDNLKLDYKYVINPMGFDSFGLPAENAARQRGINPAVWTNSNIRSMKQQLDDLALQFDWREATSNPSFYKWTQELFLKLMDAGLVYKSYAQVNWDPVDKTVLADEQVDEEGRSWRSGALVEKRNFEQWFVKTNRFTNDIYEATDVNLEGWSDIVSIQRNWIGKPNGWLFYLPIEGLDPCTSKTLPIFTKNPELFLQSNVQLIINTDHWLEEVYKISKIGYIKNPFNSSQLPVTITADNENSPPSGYATLKHQSSPDEENRHTMLRQQVLLMSKLSNLGGFYTSESYRDWLVSRQRFWGTPIPVTYCADCGYQRVLNDSLPVKLPNVKEFNQSTLKNNDSIVPPIKELAPPDWLNTTCSSCGSKAHRECETLDTLFDSSWYFLRYATSPTAHEPFNSKKVQPVWCYIGGKEHANMHLFYSRFITHFLHHIGQLDFKEPFKELLVQGVVKSRTYKLNGKYLTYSDVNNLSDKKNLIIEYEKMSKSKGNGVDPQELLDTYGIDATRFCLMSYANPRSERLWRTSDEEFKDVMAFLRRVVLTVDEYTKIGRSLATKEVDQNSTLRLKELDSEESDIKKADIVKLRNESVIDSTFHLQESRQFRQYISSLHILLNSIRTNLNSTVAFTKEFADSLASLIVLLNPVVPHLSEELWTHFTKCIINPLAQTQDTSFKVNLQAADQPWPLPDNEYPLRIKVRHRNSSDYVARIEISKHDLNCSSDAELANLVESYFSERDDRCSVLEVRKYKDLTAIVVADIQSEEENLRKNRKKKKKSNKITTSD